MSEETRVRSIDEWDVQRYLGLWFELGRLPLSFEDDEASDITSHYAMEDDGTITIDNRRLDGFGAAKRSIGHAELDPHHAGRLRVSFMPAALRWLPFTRGDYWVLDVDRQYRIALIGTPNTQRLHLLAREPRVDEAVETALLRIAKKQGFDLAGWIRPRQSGHVVDDAALQEPPAL